MCLPAPGSLVRCICQFCYRGLMRPEGLEPSLRQETGLKPVVSSVPPRALTYFSFRKSHNRYKIPMMESPFIKYYLQERESNPLSQTRYGPGMVIPFHSPAEPMTGVEPATYCLQGSRTASCATSALIYCLMIFKYARQESNPQSLDISQVQRTASPQALIFFLWRRLYSSHHFFLHSFSAEYIGEARSGI